VRHGPLDCAPAQPSAKHLANLRERTPDERVLAGLVRTCDIGVRELRRAPDVRFEEDGYQRASLHGRLESTLRKVKRAEQASQTLFPSGDRGESRTCLLEVRVTRRGDLHTHRFAGDDRLVDQLIEGRAEERVRERAQARGSIRPPGEMHAGAKLDVGVIDDVDARTG
jgi:hypothetical protein